MDVDQRLAIRRQHPFAASKTFLITALAADTPLEVRDPIDGDASVFQTCYEHITRAVQPLVRVLAGDAI
jgi:protein-tyrosine-phosphatase